MSRRTKVLFTICIGLIVLIVLLETGPGQMLMRGRIPRNVTHFELDDIYMGAALAPIAWGGLLFVFFFIAAVTSLVLDRLRARNSQTAQITR